VYDGETGGNDTDQELFGYWMEGERGRRREASKKFEPLSE
jgi:hypothetical protein